MSDLDDEYVASARIPADVSKSDQVLGPLTARQTAVLAVAALVLYGGYWATHPFMAPLAYAALVAPVSVVVTVIAVGRRDGIGMDQLLQAAIRFHRTPKRHVPAPEGGSAPSGPGPRRLAYAGLAGLRRRCSCRAARSPTPVYWTSPRKAGPRWRCAARSTSICAPAANSRR
ncbi:PrgI family protein [Streptomyces sp. S1D4-11]